LAPHIDREALFADGGTGDVPADFLKLFALATVHSHSRMECESRILANKSSLAQVIPIR
jgi:hypothetical protein